MKASWLKSSFKYYAIVAFVLSICHAPIASAQGPIRVSVDSAGAESNEHSFYPVLSADGRVIAFYSTATNLVAGDTNGLGDIFVYDRMTSTCERVSVSSSGVESNSTSSQPAISADGRFIAFQSFAFNLVPNDTNKTADVFVFDRQTRSIERVSVDSTGAQANLHAAQPAISADGQVIAFVSASNNLVAGDTNGKSDIFVRDRTTATTTRVSVDSSGGQANGDCQNTAISADGNVVGFNCAATNLVPGDTNGFTDVFVHDRTTLVTQRVSVSASGAQGNGESRELSLSLDGSVIAFTSNSSNLISVDRNHSPDVFVRDRVAGTVECVSVDANGAPAVGGSPQYRPAISDDGAIVAFMSTQTNLVSGDTNSVTDAFFRDRSTSTTVRVTVDANGVEANDWCYPYAEISADGGTIAFVTEASNLVSGDTNSKCDIFVADRGVYASWVNYGTGFSGSNGVPGLTARNKPVVGTTLDVDIGNSSLLPTFCAIYVGDQSTSIPMKKGGSLLVLPQFVFLIALPPAGITISEPIDDDPTLWGVEFFAQSLIVDPGAAKGQAASAGLHLILGR